MISYSSATDVQDKRPNFTLSRCYLLGHEHTFVLIALIPFR